MSDQAHPHPGPAIDPDSDEPLPDHIYGDIDAYLAAVQEGIDAADAGRTVPLEDVQAWVNSWGTDNELPPPKCRSS